MGVPILWEKDNLVIKIHCEGSMMYLNPEKIFLMATVVVDTYRTGVCLGYQPDGTMIVIRVDETPEELLALIAAEG